MQSLHPAAEYHAAARAVGGCSIYVRYLAINILAQSFSVVLLEVSIGEGVTGGSGLSFGYSDKPGNHDFELLKKLVLPDGSVLRAQLPGRPTRDCLFADPARDGKR